MRALEKIRIRINSFEFLMHLLGASLSLLMLGYAASGITVSIFCLFCLRYFILNPTRLKLDIALLLPVLLYLYFITTYFWSVDIGQTTKGFERMLVLAIVPLAFSIIPKISYKNHKIVLNIFTISNTVLGLLFLLSAIYNFINTNSFSVFTYHELVKLLDLNAIYVTLTFSVSLFYLLSLKSKTNTENWQIVFFLLIIFLLSSKIIIPVLFFAFIIFLQRQTKIKLHKRNIILIILFAIVGLSISSITLYKRFVFEKDTVITEVFNKKTFGKVYYWTGSSIRLFQLRLLKEQIEEESKLVHGFGLFASKKNLEKRHIDYNTYHTFHKYNYHNQYAQILSETGLIGLAIFLSLLFFLITKARMSKDYGFLLFSIMVAFVFLTESVLWRQRGLFLFIIFYCLYHRTVFNEPIADN